MQRGIDFDWLMLTLTQANDILAQSGGRTIVLKKRDELIEFRQCCFFEKSRRFDSRKMSGYFRTSLDLR
jgi:hypothetical protein